MRILAEMSLNKLDTSNIHDSMPEPDYNNDMVNRLSYPMSRDESKGMRLKIAMEVMTG